MAAIREMYELSGGLPEFTIWDQNLSPKTLMDVNPPWSPGLTASCFVSLQAPPSGRMYSSKLHSRCMRTRERAAFRGKGVTEAKKRPASRRGSPFQRRDKSQLRCGGTSLLAIPAPRCAAVLR